jgi:hypothetical protein
MRGTSPALELVTGPFFDYLRLPCRQLPQLTVLSVSQVAVLLAGASPSISTRSHSRPRTARTPRIGGRSNSNSITAAGAGMGSMAGATAAAAASSAQPQLQQPAALLPQLRRLALVACQLNIGEFVCLSQLTELTS